MTIMAHEIGIGANFESAKDSFKEFSSMIQNLSKTPFQIKLDTKLLDVAQKNLSSLQTGFQTKFKSLSKTAQDQFIELDKAINQALDPEVVTKMRDAFAKTNDELTDTRKLLEDIARAQRGLGLPGIGGGSGTGSGGAGGGGGWGGRGAGGTVVGGLAKRAAIGMGRGVGGFGMVSPIFNLMSLAGPVGMGAAAIAGGLGALWSVSGQRRRIADTNLQLRGLGVENTDAGLKRLGQLGERNAITMEQTLQEARDLAREGGRDAVKGRVRGMSGLEMFQSMQRGTGLGAGELMPMVGAFRRGGETGQNALRRLSDAFRHATAAGIEDARLSDYVKVQTDFIGQMSDNTQTNTKSVDSLMAELTHGSQFYQQNLGRVGKTLEGIQKGWEKEEPFGQTMAYRALLQYAPNADPAQLMLMKGSNLFSTSFQQMLNQASGRDVSIKDFLRTWMGEISGTGSAFSQIEEGTPAWSKTQLFLKQQLGMAPDMIAEMMRELQSPTLTEEEFKKKFEKGVSAPEDRAAKFMDTTDGHLKAMEWMLDKMMNYISDMAAQILNFGPALGSWLQVKFGAEKYNKLALEGLEESGKRKAELWLEQEKAGVGKPAAARWTQMVEGMQKGGKPLDEQALTLIRSSGLSLLEAKTGSRVNPAKEAIAHDREGKPLAWRTGRPYTDEEMLKLLKTIADASVANAEHNSPKGKFRPVPPQQIGPAKKRTN